MWSLSLPVMFWLTIAIELLALASMAAARLCGTNRRRAVCHQFFVIMLLALGLMTVLALSSDSHSWVTSGATLSIMTVCATFDFRGDGGRSMAF